MLFSFFLSMSLLSYKDVLFSFFPSMYLLSYKNALFSFFPSMSLLSYKDMFFFFFPSMSLLSYKDVLFFFFYKRCLVLLTRASGSGQNGLIHLSRGLFFFFQGGIILFPGVMYWARIHGSRRMS